MKFINWEQEGNFNDFFSCTYG